MNTLKEQRALLASCLGQVATVIDHLPERMPTPSAVIAAGSPYLEAGDTFGSYRIRFTVVLVCGKGTNEAETDALDQHVSATVVALAGSDWTLERVDQPTMLAHGGASYLSTTVDVLKVLDDVIDGWRT